MPRQARIVVPDVALHIVQRGHDKRDCFREESDYLVYLTNLRDLVAKTGCALHSYCLMTNHIHLLLTPPTLSACAQLMRNLGQRYVQYFNRRYRRSGTLWEGRFKSCLVDSAHYVLGCYRYIERNPVKAGMVASPSDYRWSSYGGNAGRVTNRLVTPHVEYLALAQDPGARLAAYQALLGRDDEPEFLAAIRDATNGGFALVGDSVKSRLPAERQPRLARRRPGPAPDDAQDKDDLTAELGLRPRIGTVACFSHGMPNKDIVVIGASAGGMEALQKVVANLPADLPASVFVVWHLAPGAKSILPSILSKAGPLPAAHPVDGDSIEPGRIYVAPNDHHMLVEKGYIRVARGPKENRFRPAIDPLFRSAAYVYGPRVIGVVLTGALDDGTAGLWTIKLRGGTAVVQEPSDALIRSMPLNALDNVAVDHRLPASEIGALLGRLARQQAPAPVAVAAEEDEKTRHEIRIAKEREALEEGILDFGELSPFTCPECHGVLAMLREDMITRFRCHTGHAFSAGTLLESAAEAIEARLWDAVRAVDETVMLLNHLGEELAKAGNAAAAARCFDKAREAHERMAPVREKAMESGSTLQPD